MKLPLPRTYTTHTLPLERLAPEDFERLCFWLVRKEGYERVEALGQAGQDQGRDILAFKDGTVFAFQCKRTRRFGPKMVISEIKKILELAEDNRPDEIVFLVTCGVSALTRARARAAWGLDTTCHFWAGNELDYRIKQHPEILEEFFGLEIDDLETAGVTAERIVEIAENLEVELDQGIALKDLNEP